MPISLSRMQSNTQTISIPYFEDTVSITYKPSEMTPVVEAQIREASNAGDEKVMLEVLSRLVVSWDVLDEKEKPIPVTAKTMATMPSAFLTAIFTGIRDDMVPKAKTGRSSFGR